MKPWCVVLSLAIAWFLLSCPTTSAHIIGPGIIEPRSDGWSMIDSDPGTIYSSIADVDRVSAPTSGKGLGLVFAGARRFGNGTRAGWMGYARLNGTLVWQKTIQDPRMDTIAAIQFNTTDQVYVAGSGAEGPSVWCMNINGSVVWNSTFGSTGDTVRSMAIIKHDAGFTSNDNGITIALSRDTDLADRIININSNTGNVTVQHAPVISQANNTGRVEVLGVATDPLLPSIVYIGGRYVNTTTGRWAAFIEQFNITSGQPSWHRAVSFADMDCAMHGVQVEPIYGHVFCVGEIGGDAMVYPFSWYTGEDGWNTRPVPYARWGGLKSEVATDVVIVGEQSFMLYVTGWTDGWSIGGKDAFVFKMDYNARIQWEKTWGAMFDDASLGITAEPGTGIYICGVAASKGFMVENPSGTINVAAKVLGSNDMVIGITIAISCAIAFAIIAVFARKRNAKREALAAWVSKKKQERGTGSET